MPEIMCFSYREHDICVQNVGTCSCIFVKKSVKMLISDRKIIDCCHKYSSLMVCGNTGSKDAAERRGITSHIVGRGLRWSLV